ncbi:gamma-glutamyltransferase family protein [Acetobacter oeni]|uniref:gamma-glutamyltransferase family protein n=1 Tax=Acetobacter oeni TaxID=304077 RepID=UPI0017B6485D|nr:gamma-glutamyltransferase family protein [Acetobacter oeni]MBB3882752.1 gamma-glutamyltranspeptidase/glutathione hydrolase [Acetobacter oeni]
MRPHSDSRPDAPAASRFRRTCSVLRRAGFAVAATGLLSGCSWFPFSFVGAGEGNGGTEHQVLSLFGSGSHIISGYTGNIVADEPQAAIAAQTVLERGGNAADAAAALGLALSVTLPSRASLGAGGACLAWRPGDKNGGQAFIFLPTGDSPADTVQGPTGHADRPASAPMLPRGLFLMQLRYGSVDFAELTQPALHLARSGFEVGTQLASDLSAVQAPLLADDSARSVFARQDGSVMKAGDILVQPRLAGSLTRIHSAGPGDLYIGSLAQAFVSASDAAGAGITMAGLRNALPQAVMPLTITVQGTQVSFLPPPADGGYGMAVAWRAMENGRSGTSGVGAQAVAGWRASESRSNTPSVLAARARQLIDSGHIPSGGTLPNLPASTSFAVVDRKGEAVACALTMNNLFGTGRVAGSTGIVLGASSAHLPWPLLPAAIAHRDDQFIATATASGQADAADAAAAALSGALHGDEQAMKPATVAGRANAISCPSGLPGNNGRCFGSVDPRGSGYASGTARH